MLSQDELDKLLAEGMDDDSTDSGEEVKDAAQDAAEDKEGAGDHVEKGAEEDISWDDAFKEAADGGDAAAKKAIEEEGSAPQGDVHPSAAGQPGPASKAADFQDFGADTRGEKVEHPDLDFILDIPLDVSVELGRTRLRIKDLLQLGQGSVVELNKLAGEPAEIYVNQKLMAKGEIVVVNEKFGVRLTEIISPSDRVKQLG